MKKLISIVLLLTITKAFSQVNIVPQPAEVKMKTGNYILSANTKIIYGKGAEKQVQYLQDYLKNNYNLNLSSSLYNGNSAALNTNSIQIFYKADTAKPDSYRLEVFKNKLYIQGNTAPGVFYGIQTLLQLLPASHQLPDGKKVTIPLMVINDHPRFAYRGSMLDVGRHFFPVSYIKKYIDYLAFNKFNNFHWHLTEDQGWRIEIKKYPRLTSVGAFRNGTIIGRYPGKGNDNEAYGGFYTQEEIKEVVQYATDRYITVIPEIEMPGHSSAAIAAYPQLSCFPDQKTVIRENMSSEASKKATGKLVQETWGVFEDVYCPSDYTFKFLEDVLDEVMVLFPSKYIHIGGDECPKEAWKKSAFCQQLIKEKGLKDEHGLQSYFIQTVEKYINSKGRKIIGWDEILEGGLAPNATVMSWRGEKGGIDAAKQNHDVIMTPGTYCYLDHSQTKKEDSVTIGGFLPLEKVYSYEPIPAELNEQQGKHVLGAQANVWTEYMANTAKVEYMIFPRLSALAEVLWSPKENRNYADFEKRLPAIFNRYDFWGANYSKAYYEAKESTSPAENKK
jgi:hexosaminidase